MELYSTPLPKPEYKTFFESQLSDKLSSRKKKAYDGISCPQVPFKVYSKTKPRSLFRQSLTTGQARPDHSCQLFMSDDVFSAVEGLHLSPDKTSVPLSNSPPACSALPLDKVFQLSQKIGCGSFGEVYEVRCCENNELYAVKKSKLKFRSKKDRDRKWDEVEKLRLVGNHSNCLKLVNAWEEFGYLFIQTELCLFNLEQAIEHLDDGVLWERDSWFILADMLSALSHLCSLSLAHLDVKPANIFVDSQSSFKLGDYGLATYLDYKANKIDAQEGDPRYLAPEAIRGIFSSAADVFSLGATVLECATGIELPINGLWWNKIRQSLDFIPEEYKLSKLL